MLKSIAARAAQPTLIRHGNCLATRLRNGRFSTRARGAPSAFPDWRQFRSSAPQRTYWRSTFDMSTAVAGASDNRNEQRFKTLNGEDLKKIENRKEIFPPPNFDKEALNDAYLHKKPAVTLAKEFSKRMQVQEPDATLLSAQSLSEHLLASVDALANADKVMIFCGRNTTEGKLTVDSAVSAAIAAYALHLCYKTPVIVCDEPNKRLIQKLLTDNHPEFGPYLSYVSLTEVNGWLVRRLQSEFERHAPDIALYIDVPGRNRYGDYLDANGSSISLLNVALDQALNLQNLKGIPSIAICNSKSSAGFPAATSPAGKEEDDDAAVIRATHPLFVSDVLQGTLGLMELLCSACLDSQAYQPEWLVRALDTATQLTESGEFKAPVPRAGALQHRKWDTKLHVPITTEHPALKQLSAFHELTGARRITWTESIEKAKVEGPRVHHVVLYDSSDGVLIAANDFIRYFRARSNFLLKVDAVADHANASYGKHSPERLLEIVVDGVAFSAKLKPDAIVMVCNTACTVDLVKVKSVVEKWLQSHGIQDYDVHIINLIETVASMVAEIGGSKPTLLTTEATSKSDAYEVAIARAADHLKSDRPDVVLIGCGNRKARPNRDLAHLVNKLAHLQDPTTPAYQELIEEVKHYVALIPLDSTAVFLCCTHFPALKELIRQYLNERLERAGLPRDSILIVDPISAQVEKTIDFFKKRKHTDKKDNQAVQDLRVLTTGIKNEMANSMNTHIKRKVPLFTVNFPNVIILHPPSPRVKPASQNN